MKSPTRQMLEEEHDGPVNAGKLVAEGIEGRVPYKGHLLADAIQFVPACAPGWAAAACARPTHGGR